MKSADFIVVGGGPAGITLATNLAKTSSRPTVILLEAGGENSDVTKHVGANRYRTFMSAPGCNWNYESVPQRAALNGRILNHSSGRGLGGGTSINFAAWTRGPKTDYDRLAREVGDEDWGWESMVERWRSLESVAPSEDWESDINYSEPVKSMHGTDGPIGISVEPIDDGTKRFIDYTRKLGYTRVLDMNAGDPQGVGACQVNVSKGRRMTAAALLINPTGDLQVYTDTTVSRLILEGTKVVGVAAGEREFYASKEVILSAGYAATPKLLFLSGIGARAELEKFGIPSVVDLPGVGKGLQDHAWTHVAFSSPEGVDFYAENTDKDAMEQWARDLSGPFAKAVLPCSMAYLHNPDVAKIDEFQKLEKELQNYHSDRSTLHYEFIFNGPAFVPSIDPTRSHTVVVGFQNPISTGTIALRSADPTDSPLIDTQILTHPFDRAVAIDSLRKVLELLDGTGEKLLSGPEGRDDDSIWKYIASSAMSMWHGSGSVAMGRCVDSNLRVKGVQGLRVADTSVMPFVVSAHTQAVAYAIGATAAAKIAREYHL